MPTMSKARRQPRVRSTARSTYRHGDLRRALLDAGIALAQAAGLMLSCYARRRDGLGWSQMRPIGTSRVDWSCCRLVAHHGAVAPCALNGGAADALSTTLDSVELAGRACAPLASGICISL